MRRADRVYAREVRVLVERDRLGDAKRGEVAQVERDLAFVRRKVGRAAGLGGRGERAISLRAEEALEDEFATRRVDKVSDGVRDETERDDIAVREVAEQADEERTCAD